MIRHTIVTQRSFTNSWAYNSSLFGLPSGVILDLSITLPEGANNAIYLTQARVDNGSITLRFRDTDGVEVGVLSTDVTGIPVVMDSPENIVGHVLIGYIPTTSGELLTNSTGIRINPTLIHRYTPMAARTVQRLTVTVDDQLVIDEELESDLVLMGGAGILVKKNKISRIDDVTVGDTTQVGQDTVKLIYSINDVAPDKYGNISVTVSVPQLASTTQPTVTAKGSYIQVDSTDENIKKLLKPVDIIDDHVAPGGVREFNYYPLDDAYMEGTELGSVRDTVTNLENITVLTKVAFADAENTTDKGTASSVDINAVNPLYDDTPTEDEYEEDTDV